MTYILILSLDVTDLPWALLLGHMHCSSTYNNLKFILHTLQVLNLPYSESAALPTGIRNDAISSIPNRYRDLATAAAVHS